MTNDLVRKIASVMSKAMTLICVRNTCLETLHAGPGVVSHTGDYSEVPVTDANGRQIPWSELSRISDDEMRDLMREIVNPLYTFQLRVGEQEFRDYLDLQLTSTQSWDEPRHDWNLAPGTLAELERVPPAQQGRDENELREAARPAADVPGIRPPGGGGPDQGGGPQPLHGTRHPDDRGRRISVPGERGIALAS